MDRVKDKVAIVTGAAGGLGAEDAKLLVAEGARVVLTDIDEERGRETAAALGDAARFMAHDIASEADWKRVIADTEAAFGGVDILINNAGILRAGSIEETSLDLWRQIQTTNADGYFLGCKYGLEAMKKRPSGSIINMSSISAILGMSAFAAYSASKGTVTALTRSVAAHCKRHGLAIRCNAVVPDGIKTPMVARLHETVQPGQLPEMKDMEEAMARIAEPRDIATMVLFLASDESRFVNGAEMRVDNGWSMWGD